MKRWRAGRPWRRLVALTLLEHGTTCHLCGRPGATSADHVIPRRDGGRDVLANLKPSHPRCNSRRGALPLDEWFARHPLPAPASVPPSREW